MYRIFSTRLTPLVVALGMVFWGLSPSAAMAVAADRCHYDVPGALDVSGLCQHDSGGADQRQAGSRGDLCHTPRSVVRFTGSDAPGHGHDVLVPSPPVISASAAAESRCPQIVGDDDGIATTAAMAKSAATTRAALTYTPRTAAGGARVSHLGDDVARQVDDAIERAAQGKIRFPGHDGKVFDNTDGLLPPSRPGYYSEWTAAASGAKRGAHRVIVGGNPASPDVIYYWDHAGNYVQVWP